MNVTLVGNLIYLVFILVYTVPFVAVLIYDALETAGMIDHMPEWTNDTSWKGFFTSPVRMWKRRGTDTDEGASPLSQEEAT